MAVVPVYNSILVPESTFVLQTDYYKKMTGKVPNQGEKVTVLFDETYDEAKAWWNKNRASYEFDF